MLMVVIFGNVDADGVDILGCEHGWHIKPMDIIADIMIFGPMYRHIGL
jgi:hypothetical protein